MANSNDKLELRSAQEKSEIPSSANAEMSPQACDYQAPPYNNLPFLHFPKDYDPDTTRYWQVPHADDYCDACYRGYEYAFMFIQFLRDYPDETVESNLLGSIASHIDFEDDAERKGYWVGFFSYIEKVLYEQAKVMNFEQERQRLSEEFSALRHS